MMTNKFIVPIDLDIEKLMKKVPVAKRIGFSKAKVYFVCHSIYVGLSFSHDNEESKVSLNSPILKKHLGNDYKAILNWMVKSEIIEIGNSYQVKVASKLYSFTKRYTECGGEFRTVKSRKMFREKFKPIHGYSNEMKHLRMYLKDSRLHFDRDAAENWIESKTNDESETVLDKIEVLMDHIKISRMSQMSDEPFIQDKFGHRLHTPITQLPRELRQFVRLNGEGLVQIDVKNSQLYFLNCLTMVEFWKKQNGSYETKKLNLIWRGLLTPNDFLPIINNSIMYIESYESTTGYSFQEKIFFQDSTSGVLYEKIVLDIYGPDLDSETFKIYRERVKKCVVALLNADYNEHFHMYREGLSGQVWRSFNKLYPEVIPIVNNLKKGSNILGSILQRVESFGMLKLVVGRLRQEYPDVPVFTLHDCIVTTKKHQMLVVQVVKEELAKYVGIAPRLDISNWSDGLRDKDISIAV